MPALPIQTLLKQPQSKAVWIDLTFDLKIEFKLS
jgi:hypothetical protein